MSLTLTEPADQYCLDNVISNSKSEKNKPCDLSVVLINFLLMLILLVETNFALLPVEVAAVQ